MWAQLGSRESLEFSRHSLALRDFKPGTCVSVVVCESKLCGQQLSF
jgi:hypothetical protein